MTQHDHRFDQLLLFGLGCPNTSPKRLAHPSAWRPTAGPLLVGLPPSVRAAINSAMTASVRAAPNGNLVGYRRAGES
jgi:hypothetical protein